ncbi:hypothetical protein Chor_009663, partial [Crotalus horridus]
RRFGHSKSPLFREKSPLREPLGSLSPEERDARTVFCMQLAARIRPRDLEDFFSAVGKAEKNRLAAMANNLQKGSGGPMRLYVGSLHCNITKEMLRGIFEPFGKIDSIVLMRDQDTGQSKGYGFITVTERLDGTTDITFPDGADEHDRSALSLGTTSSQLQLMAKLAEAGSGIPLSTTAAAHAALQLNGAIPLGALNPAALTALSPALNLASQTLASQCFQLSGLFSPQTM